MPKDRSCPITVSSLPQGKCMTDRHHNQHHHGRHYCLSTPAASGRSVRQVRTPRHIVDNINGGIFIEEVKKVGLVSGYIGGE